MNFHITIALFALSISRVIAQYTNLPEVAPGVFNASTRIEIKTTTSAVWNALTNFPDYASWNPFVRLVYGVTS